MLAEVTAEHPLPEDPRLLQPAPGGSRSDETPAARHQGARHHTVIRGASLTRHHRAPGVDITGVALGAVTTGRDVCGEVRRSKLLNKTVFTEGESLRAVISTSH